MRVVLSLFWFLSLFLHLGFSKTPVSHCMTFLSRTLESDQAVSDCSVPDLCSCCCSFNFPYNLPAVIFLCPSQSILPFLRSHLSVEYSARGNSLSSGSQSVQPNFFQFSLFLATLPVTPLSPIHTNVLFLF